MHLLLTLTCFVFVANERLAVEDRELVEKTISQMVTGIDLQDGAEISGALASNAAIFGTHPDGGGVITVSKEEFVELHASGRFGGESRDLTFEYLDVTRWTRGHRESRCLERERELHVLLEPRQNRGRWLIQTLLQRGRRP